MSKLSKRQAAAHLQACQLLEKDRLSLDDRYFVLDNWQESANHINSMAGAFFTPTGLARDFAIEVSGQRIIDLCAGIGGLAFAVSEHLRGVELVCVEKNPAYVEVGRRIVPDAIWILGDVFDLPDLGRFDCVISNPPFGATKRTGNGGAYTGRAFEFHVIEIASRLAGYGVFIIPQMSAPFEYSGRNGYLKRPSVEHDRFKTATGFEFGPSCGIDTAFYADDWRGVSPKVEIVVCDFEKPPATEPSEPAPVDRLLKGQADLLDLIPTKDAA